MPSDFLLKIVVISTILISIKVSANANVSSGTDETAQLPFWQWQNQTVSIRLVQRLPDQTRAFFTARKFSNSDAEKIAQSCVFQTVFKNVSESTTKTIVRFNLNDWRITHAGQHKRLKVKEQWLKQWQETNVPQKAQIAFSWSLLPTEQQYQAGDYNWGMTTFNLPAGQRFDLELVWYENEKRHSGIINNIECGPDIELAPVNGIGG